MYKNNVKLAQQKIIAAAW